MKAWRRTSSLISSWPPQTLLPMNLKATLQTGLSPKGCRPVAGDTWLRRDVGRQLRQEINRLQTELDLYQAALKPMPQSASMSPAGPHRLIIESDMPDYHLSIAQQHAARYYQEKFRLSKEAKVAQHFSGQVRPFEPDNSVVHKEFPGLCAPFVQTRTGAGTSCCRLV
jgi:hypothetical protein